MAGIGNRLQILRRGEEDSDIGRPDPSPLPLIKLKLQSWTSPESSWRIGGCGANRW